MRRRVEILEQFTVATLHDHHHLREARDNYAALFEEMGWCPAQILARPSDAPPPPEQSLLERKRGGTLTLELAAAGAR
jgi:hypothetical protein